MASQLERSARLHESRGTDVCAHLDAPWTLFALWDRIFGDEVYEATYFPEARRGDGPAADAPRPIRTRVGLAAEDKALLERTLLEGRWQGDRRSDLASRYCPG